MRLAWTTDTHLDFLSLDARTEFCEEILCHSPDRLLITGDIANARSFGPCLRHLAERLDIPVDFVLGNHDYYGQSIASVREEARGLSLVSDKLRWAHGLAPLALTERTAMVGVDGWGDARLGDFDHTPVMLNDFVQIPELSGISRGLRKLRLRALGDESARSLEGPLDEALSRFEEVLVLTHVPPFREACWHEGGVSSEDWLPYFSCKAVGEVLLTAANKHPHRHITVLCGHTHSAGECSPAENLRVYTGDAAYGDPSVKRCFEVF